MTPYHIALIAMAVIMLAPMVAYEYYHSKKESSNNEE